MSLAPGPACSSPETPDALTPEDTQPISLSNSAAGSGVLAGEVLFEGSTVPASTLVKNTTDPQDCGDTQSLGNILISPDGQGIKNVIVTLHGVPLPEDYRPEPSPLALDNRNCQFQPHVSVVTSGSRIDANRDGMTTIGLVGAAGGGVLFSFIAGTIAAPRESENSFAD